MPAGLLPLWPLSQLVGGVFSGSSVVFLCAVCLCLLFCKDSSISGSSCPLALLLITSLKMLPPNIVILRYSLVVGYDLTLGDSASVTPAVYTHHWGERTFFPPSLTIINGECINSLRCVLDAHKG